VKYNRSKRAIFFFSHNTILHSVFLCHMIALGKQQTRIETPMARAVGEYH